MRKFKFSTEISHIVPTLTATQLAAGGEPSTRFPPEGLVETAGNTQRPRNTWMRMIKHDCIEKTTGVGRMRQNVVTPDVLLVLEVWKSKSQNSTLAIFM